MNADISSSRLSVLARQVSIPKVADFLVDLANLAQDDRKAALRFGGKYKDLLPSIAHAALVGTKEGNVEARSMNSALSVGSILMTADGQPGPIPSWIGPVRMLAELLRVAWNQPTTLGREMRILGLLSELLRLYADRESPIESYKNDQLMLLMVRSLQLAEKMRHCANPECAAPYFLSTRRSQRYCSEPCALPAQREFKRTWWRENRGRLRMEGKVPAPPKGKKTRGKRGTKP